MTSDGARQPTESDVRGSRVLPDPARVARYAEAMSGFEVMIGFRDEAGGDDWACGTVDRDGLRAFARAVVSVADEEHAALVAERDMLKRGAKTLGEIIENQCRMVLDATGLHDWVDEDGDGDWGAIWDHLFELRPTIEGLQEHVRVQTHFVQQWQSRALAAEAKVAKVEALANSGRMPWAIALMDGSTVADHLRAALADAPAEQRAEGGA